MEDIIKRIDELCDERKWTFYELGKQADISTNALYKWRSGTQPTVANLEKVCDAFGITLKQFFYGLNDDFLTSEQNNLLKSWVLLKKNQKELIANMIKTFLEDIPQEPSDNSK